MAWLRSVMLAVVPLVTACGGATHIAATSQPQPPAPVPEKTFAPTNVANDDPPPKRLQIDWANVHLASDADALALWQQINPTTEDLAAKLGEIPSNAAITKPLAQAMLRSGNFACPSRNISQTCTPVLELTDPPANATLHDPCLRRELALWSIDQLDDNDAVSVGPALVAIAGLPLPDLALPAAAFDLLPLGADGDKLTFDMAIAAHRAGRPVPLPGETSPAVLARLLNEHHVIEALQHLTMDDARVELLHALNDPQMPVAARLAIVDEVTRDLVTPLPPDIQAALQRATRDPNCRVASIAARATGATFRPSLSSQPVAAFRALCVAALADAPLDSFLDRGGVTVVRHEADAADSELQVLAPSELHTLDADALRAMAGTCVAKGTNSLECIDRDVRAEFGFKRGRLARLVLSDASQACEKNKD